MNKSIHERSLLDYSLCPLRVTPYADTTRGFVETDAELVANKLLMASFTGQTISLRQIREALEKQRKGGPPGCVYPAGHLVRISARLHELHLKYRVIQPTTPYQLNVHNVSINGEYAVLRRAEKKVAVLRLHYPNTATDSLLRPNILTYCRWLHLRLSDIEANTFSVFTFNLLKNEQRFETYDERTVRDAVIGLGTQYNLNPRYPTPGLHCATCSTNACLGK